MLQSTEGQVQISIILASVSMFLSKAGKTVLQGHLHASATFLHQVKAAVLELWL